MKQQQTLTEAQLEILDRKVTNAINGVGDAYITVTTREEAAQARKWLAEQRLGNEFDFITVRLAPAQKVASCRG